MFVLAAELTKNKWYSLYLKIYQSILDYCLYLQDEGWVTGKLDFEKMSKYSAPSAVFNVISN